MTGFFLGWFLISLFRPYNMYELCVSLKLLIEFLSDPQTELLCKKLDKKNPKQTRINNRNVTLQFESYFMSTHYNHSMSPLLATLSV